MIRVLDHGYVKYVEHWGSDERIIESARMSTSGSFKGWGPIACEGAGDEKLLRYLWTHKHTTPFEMAGLTVEVQAPIFVFREWQRHRTQSFNEMSARYTELPDLFYVPDYERLRFGGQSKTNKQTGNTELGDLITQGNQAIIEHAFFNARKTYEELLARGLSRELARLVIPVAQYSRMRASANLWNWLAFLTLRMAPGAQWEIRQYANVVHDILVEKFPRTMELFDADTTGT